MFVTFCRLTSLDRSRRRLAFEAATLIAFARVGLRFFRFLTLRRMFDRFVVPFRPGEPAARRAVAIESVRWAIAVTAARMPSATCLVQALAADAMLRRRGLQAELRFGVRRSDGSVPLEAHAWVDCGDGVTIGTDHQAEFAVLTAVESR